MAAWDMAIRALDTTRMEDTTLTHTGDTIHTEGSTDTTGLTLMVADTIPILVMVIGPGTTAKEVLR